MSATEAVTRDDSEALAPRFAANFGSQECTRGEELFARGRVAELWREKTGWRGKVDGRVETRLKISPSGKGLRPICSCEERQPCAHAWAMLLEADRLIDAARRLGPEHPKWFIFDRKSGQVLAWKNGETRAAALGSRSTATDSAEPMPGAASEAAPAPPLIEQPWQRRLAQLADPRRSPPARVDAASAALLGYAIDPDPEPDGALGVHVLVRRPLRDGSFTWLPFDQAAPAKVADLAPLDRRVIELARGMVSSWDELLLLRHDSRLMVPAPVLDVVLPLLAATGRARWHDWGRHRAIGFDDAPLLELDDGAPLDFRARLERRDEQIELRPELSRDGAPIELPPIDAVHGAYARVGPRLVRLDVGEAQQLAAQLLTAGPLSAPSAHAEQFVQALVALPDAARIAGDGIAAEPLPPRIGLCVGAPVQPRAATVPAELVFDYDGTRLSGASQQAFVPRGEGLAPRDRAAELRASERLREAGAMPSPDGHLTLPRERLLTLLTRLLDEGYWIEAEQKALRRASTPSIRVRSGIDWFELEAQVPFGDQLVPLPEVLAALKRNERMVPLGDGTLGFLPEDWLLGWDALLALGDDRKGRLRFASSQAFLLDLLLAATTCELDVDKAFAERRARLAGFARIEAKDEPAAFEGQLRPYQRLGLGWLAFLQQTGLGGCLADDMGLGKTVQVLAHLVATCAQGAGRPTLVVAPRSLVFNWRREAARFAPGLGVLDFTGAGRWEQLGLGEVSERSAENAAMALSVFDLVLTTYGTLLRDVQILREVPFHVVVLDEAQAIKNSQSQTAKAARLLRAEHRLALSGTPVENHLDELWSIFEFLNPGMLGRSKAFADFVEAGPSLPGAGLRDLLRPFMLRRTKEQVLADLPPKIEQVLDCELDPVQREYYDALRDGVRNTLLDRIETEGLENSQVQVLTALLRLRQAACHPMLVDPKQKAAPSAKLELLFEMLEEVCEGGHKALVFSQFTKFLALVKDGLEHRKLAHAWLDGKTRNRAAAVDRFQTDPDCKLFLISLKAGGHGLNLTAADYVFVLDPWWNPAAEAQAIDRAHRLGQTKTVVAYRLIARDTVEEKVMELQERKRALAESLFDESGGASLRDLTREDLERLLA